MALTINSYDDLIANEAAILQLIAGAPDGGFLYLIHPFLLLESVGVELSANARTEMTARQPWMKALSARAYRLVKASPSRQKVQIHIRSLAERRAS